MAGFTRYDSRHTIRFRSLDENIAAALDRRDGSDHVHGQDLRSLGAARCGAESRAPADAASHRRRDEERPHRRQQDMRLPALRFSARVILRPLHLERIDFLAADIAGEQWGVVGSQSKPVHERSGG
jgi:hypothetical protein